jgi:hypothetical protein
MAIVQLAPTAMPIVHVLVSANSLLCGPVMVTPLIVTAEGLVLVSVTVWGPLGDPTAMFPKAA